MVYKFMYIMYQCILHIPTGAGPGPSKQVSQGHEVWNYLRCSAIHFRPPDHGKSGSGVLMLEWHVNLLDPRK